MRNKFFLIILVAVTSIVYPANHLFAQPRDIPVYMKLHYLEFATSPYGPTTRDNIESSASYEIWFYGKHKFLASLQAKLERRESKKKFSGQIVRLKVEILENGNKEVYFVDKLGVVQKISTNQTFELSEKEIQELHNEIMEYRGVVDKRPKDDMWGEYQ